MIVIEVQPGLEQISTLSPQSEPRSRRWDVKDIAKNTLISAIALSATIAWSVVVARWTIDQGLPRQGAWETIRQMQADPEKYRIFNLQAHLPANPEVTDCQYFDPTVPLAKVISDPENPDKLKMVLCAPEYTKYFWIFPIE